MGKIVNCSEIKVEQHSRELELLNERVAQLESRVKDSEMKRSEIENINFIVSRNEDLIKTINEIKEFSRSQLNKVNKDMTEIDRKLSEINIKISSLSEKLDDFVSKLNELEDDVLHCNQYTNDKVGRVFEGLLKRVDDKCDAIVKDLHVSPKDILKDNEEIRLKLDSAVVGADNAMMKCNVHAMNLKLFEKRVENLALQIKEFELSKQL